MLLARRHLSLSEHQRVALCSVRRCSSAAWSRPHAEWQVLISYDRNIITHLQRWGQQRVCPRDASPQATHLNFTGADSQRIATIARHSGVARLLCLKLLAAEVLKSLGLGGIPTRVPLLVFCMLEWGAGCLGKPRVTVPQGVG